MALDQEQRSNFLSEEEYLQTEPDSEIKREYIDGQPPPAGRIIQSVRMFAAGLKHSGRVCKTMPLNMG